MNVDNIRALARKLRRLRHEEHYDQSAWFNRTSCGTAACLAGHAALLAGCHYLTKRQIDEGFDPDSEVRTPEGSIEEVESVAADWLGLTLRQRRLFSADPSGLRDLSWPDEFAERWDRSKQGQCDERERPSRIAADLLDAIADGKVEL